MSTIHQSTGLPSRPSERVRRWLDEQAVAADSAFRLKLPPAREVASRLGVSVQTVLRVYQKYAGQGRILTKAGDGTYFYGSSPGRAELAEPLRLGISMSTRGVPGLGHQWRDMVVAPILSAAGEADQPVSIYPFTGIHETPDMVERLLRLRDHVDGLILTPMIAGVKVREAFVAAGKPVVDMNPPEESATTNFVSTDYLGFSRKLGVAWRVSGRRRVLFIASTRVEHSVSSRLRFAGLTLGLAPDVGVAIALRFVDAAGDTAACGHKVVQQSVASGFVPDAIYCSGDYLAVGPAEACRQHGLRVPDEVSLVGGTGLDLSQTSCPNLTRMRQPYESLGKALVEMLIERLMSGGEPVHGRYFPPTLIDGETMRDDEKALLNA